jgi:glycosyltransferase involved in cell wall biosynthesis
VRHRLLVDLQATQSQAHADRGIARYVREQIRAILRHGAGDALLLNPHLPFPRALDQDLLVDPRLRWNTQTEIRRIASADDRPIAFYLTSPFELTLHSEGTIPPHLWRGNIPVAATLYDLIPLLDPERYLPSEKLELHYRGRVEQLHQLDLLLCISEHTRLDAIRHLGLDPDKVKTIGFGVSPFFRPEHATDSSAALITRQLPAVNRPFILTVLGGDPRKNAERLFAAYAACGLEQQLVVTCNLDPGTRRAWEIAAEDVGLVLGRDVVLTGWQPDAVLRALYQRCDLFVFPPLYEGAGLPAAEAVACGAPTITSSTSSLPEVLDYPEATFDPESIDDMVRVMRQAILDDDFRARLLAQGSERALELTWDEVARRTLEALDHLPDLGPPSLPWRVALVGPLPPNESGIADYNAQLLPHLAARCELDVFTSEPGTEPPVDGVRRFPSRALGDTCSPWSYDAVVYTIGNSDDHHDLWELAQEFPGVLWMHDVRLHGLYRTYAEARVGPAEDFLRHRLLEQYRRRLPAAIRKDPRAEAMEYLDLGLGMTKELVDVARGLVVSSDLARRLLVLDQQPDGAHRPTWVVPHAFPPVGADAHPRGEATIVSVGMVSPIKGAEVLVAAMATLREQVPEATLTFVGPVTDQYRDHLVALTRTLGVAEHVTLTGRADPASYRHWLQTATLAVQLRRTTNGESSGAIAGAMAAGLPVVTNAHAAGELPEGTVSLVPWDVDAGHLAVHLARLLADPEERRSIADAARAHASKWTFADVADRVLEVVRSLP